MAADLVWDSNGTDAPFRQDGSGTWDTTNQNWNNDLLTTNLTWTNGSKAIFGNPNNVGSNVVANNVSIAAPISVQNLTIHASTNGAIYSFDDSAGSLTLSGNMTKASAAGQSVFFLFNGLQLTDGDHVFAIRDTPTDVPELTINGTIYGNASVTVDNGDAYDAFGTLVFNYANTYTGATNIVKGRLAIFDFGALGT